MEIPPDAVSTSANVDMRYAIIPTGLFTLPKGYQLGSPVVYIYYDARRVTKPLALHLPHHYGGEDHAKDGLSFTVAPHSLKGVPTAYQFQLMEGVHFPSTNRMGSSSLMATTPCLQKCSRRRLRLCSLPHSGSSDLLARLVPGL